MIIESELISRHSFTRSPAPNHPSNPHSEALTTEHLLCEKQLTKLALCERFSMLTTALAHAKLSMGKWEGGSADWLKCLDCPLTQR